MTLGEGADSPNQRRHEAVEHRTDVGFFTDPTLCIGCKACEVACKEWNQIPADGFSFTGTSYDNTGDLDGNTWRHVLFVERDARVGRQIAGPMDGSGEDPFGWVFLSDVCKHCEVAGCLEACPTGAIFRAETGAVVVQDDVCNGCGYCVVGCPFGVIDIRQQKGAAGDGGAFKCTFCYDRQKAGLVPACAKACPTESIHFGPLEQLREQARARVKVLHERGLDDAQLYDPSDTSVGGTHAFSLVLGDPSSYGLPSRPEVPTAHQAAAWASAVATAAGLLVIAPLIFSLLAR